jgi:hypothetical protein
MSPKQSDIQKKPSLKGLKQVVDKNYYFLNTLLTYNDSIVTGNVLLNKNIKLERKTPKEKKNHFK